MTNIRCRGRDVHQWGKLSITETVGVWFCEGLVIMTAFDLLPYNCLKTPILVLNLEKLQVLYANQAGLALFHVSSRDELQQREGFNDALLRLHHDRERMRQDGQVVVPWHLGAASGARPTLACRLSEIEIEADCKALLVEFISDAPHGIESLARHVPSHQKLQAAPQDYEPNLKQAKLLELITQDVRGSLMDHHLVQIQHSLQTIADRLGNAFDVSRCHIHLYRHEPEPHLIAVAEYQFASFLSLIGLNFPIVSNRYAQELLAMERPIVVEDVPQEFQLDSLSSQVLTPNLRSMVAVRTTHEQQANGIIALSQCDSAREWTPDELNLLSLIASHVGRTLAHVKHLSQTQPLPMASETGAEKGPSAEALQLREARAQATFEQAAVGLAESDVITGHLTHVNRRFCEMVGYTEAELCGGMRIADVTHGEDLDTSIQNIQKLVSGQTSHLRFPKRYVRKDGSILGADTTVSLIRSAAGEANYCLAVIQDITERQQVERALENQVQRELLLRDITQEIRQSLDAQQIYQTTVNRIGAAFQVSRCQIHTYSLSDGGVFPAVAEYLTEGFSSMLGVNISVEKMPYAKLLMSQERALACANVYAEPLLQVSIPDDRRIELKSSLVVRTSYQGQPNGAIILEHCRRPLSRPEFMALPPLEQEQLMRQWTPEEIELLEAVASQVGIALAHARLLEQEKLQQQELTQKNVALAQAKKEADLANRAKSNFLANMSHELRTPLNGILGYGQILRRSTALSPQEQKGIRVIVECGEHLLNLIDDLLDLSKIEVERMELQTADIHLQDFLMELVHVSQLKARQKGLTFSHHLSPNLPSAIHTDEKRLRQVLMNLLDNAFKFTLQGNVTFSVDCDQYAQSQRLPKSPQHQSFAQVRCLRFKVVDTGVGIPPEDLSRIFLPFEQAGEGTFRRKGTGLGLAVSQKIMALLGGEIQVRSRLKEGSIFSVFVDLPVVDSRDDAIERLRDTSAIVKYHGEPKTLLIVDDQTSNREMFSDVLGRLGFKVLKAGNGQEGLEIATKYLPDLVLVDLVMPVMDGLEMTRALRLVPELQSLPVIASSASVSPLDQERSQEAGCDAFISKPVQIDQLLHLLQQHLRLQWVEEKASDLSADVLPSGENFALPPTEHLEAFYYLAQKGSIYEILDQLAPLEQADEKLKPFCRYLSHLIDELQVNQLKTFLTKALETHGA